jgi:hypothetical protein
MFDDDDFADMDAGSLMAMMVTGIEPLGKGSPVKEPTFVYRVEMPNGNGPFNSHMGDSHKIYDAICNPDKGWDCSRLAKGEQMGVTEFEFRKAHGHADYGCASLEALQNWFPKPAREYLNKYSAHCVVYRLEKGQHLLPTQNGEVIFDKHSATRVGVLDIITLTQVERNASCPKH